MYSQANHLERTEVNPNNESNHKKNYPDHWERYEFASKYLIGNIILDVACGAGYGTALLSKISSQKVCGLDVDSATINSATRNYGEWCNFIHIDGYHWPFENDYVDCIVTLETFEHLDNPDAFLKEANRVMKKGGIIILSTPINENDSRFKPVNPFHIREYTWNELGVFMTKYFSVESRYSQVSKIGKMNDSLKKSHFSILKNFVPKSIKLRLLSYLNKTDLKKGEILEGKIDNASVQIIIAIK